MLNQGFGMYVDMLTIMTAHLISKAFNYDTLRFTSPSNLFANASYFGAFRK